MRLADALCTREAEVPIDPPIEKRFKYGRGVAVSVIAEEAREDACLCVRNVNGETVMCRHLRQNLAYEGEIGGAGPFTEEGICRMALANFAVCLSGDVAMAVSRCPRYELEEKKA